MVASAFPYSGQMFRDVTADRGIFAVWGGEIATHLMLRHSVLPIICVV